MSAFLQILPSQYQLNRHNAYNMLVPPRANRKKEEFKIASLNIQTAWVTDSPNNLEKYSKYAWKNRLKPVIQLIAQDMPAILALSELHLTQIQDLRESFKNMGYQIVGYSSETRESIEIVEEKAFHNKDYYYSELSWTCSSTRAIFKNNLGLS